jgi:Anti-sigma factor NepR
MDDNNKSKTPAPVSDGSAISPLIETPLWAKGLEEMYASVVKEPLPDSFMELLDKLSDTSSQETTPDAGN